MKPTPRWTTFLTLATLATSPPSRAVDQVVVCTTDFSTGSISTIDIGTWTVHADVASTHGDAVLRVRGRQVFVINRFGADNVHELDPDDAWDTVHQTSTGAGSNPQDIAFLTARSAYVPRYDRTRLYELDPVAGTVTDSVSLGGLADPDGLPEMSRAVLTHGRLFVAVQRLDRNGFWNPVPPSYLAVVDPMTNTLIDVDPGTAGMQGITLLGTNPFTTVQEGAGGKLLVSTIGSFGVLDGGIERIDPVTLTSAGWLATESALGGDVLAFAVASATEGFAVISDPSFNNRLLSFNPTTGLSTGVLLTRSFPDGLATDLLVVGDRLFVGDRSATSPGVRVFDVHTRAQVTGLIAVGLAPGDLEFLDDAPVDVAGPGSTGGRPSVFPNPARARATVRVRIDVPVEGVLRVFDVSGREVQRMAAGAGRGGLLDLRLEAPLGAGAYWITGSGLAPTRFEILP